MSRDTKRLVLEHLKRNDNSTAAELAAVLGVTSVAVRQHLEQLEAAGMVAKAESSPASARKRGRPAVSWSLTADASAMFPDRHLDLTLDLLASIRDVAGDDGLDKVLSARSQRQRESYREQIGETRVELRANSLRQLRSEEGYMAELIDEGGDGFVLIEHHCPICEAATECQNLCRDELETFQHVFEGVATVQRESHLLSGDSRCAYRILPSKTSD